MSSYDDRFIGREIELKMLSNYLSSESIVLIQGGAGVGKSSLSYRYVLENEKKFKNGIHRYYAHYNVNSLKDILLKDTLKPNSLIIIDEFDFSHPDIENEIIHESKKGVKFLIISRSEHSAFASSKKIVLDGLSLLELESYVSIRGLIEFPIGDIEALYNWSSGSPLLMDLALNAIRDKKLNFRQLQQLLSRFDATGIIDSRGRPISSRDNTPPQIISSVQYVNDEMLERMRSDPKSMYKLSPRQFEELVAELLLRQGYKVELTPASGDGGVDIYAAKKDGVGKFMYLVECKRYSPSNKVGVNVVRSLHGVVQHKRANAGLVVTTSTFTKGAKEFQRDIKYQLQLADYMALHEWLDTIAKGS